MSSQAIENIVTLSLGKQKVIIEFMIAACNKYVECTCKEESDYNTLHLSGTVSLQTLSGMDYCKYYCVYIFCSDLPEKDPVYETPPPKYTDPSLPTSKVCSVRPTNIIKISLISAS